MSDQTADAEPPPAIASGPKPPRVRVALFFESDLAFEDVPFRYFVGSANASQSSFLFYFPEEPLSFAEADKQFAEGKILPAGEFDIYCFLTSEQLRGNVFWHSKGRLVRITTFGWEQHFSPPSVFEYLFKSVLCGCSCCLCPDVTMHRQESCGCVFDYHRRKDQNRVAISLGFICPEHHERLAACLGPAAFDDLAGLFSFKWLGQPDAYGTPAYTMKDVFKYDLKVDSGYKKGFFERAQANIDAMWFDFLKEIVKGLIYIAAAWVLFTFKISGK